MMRVGKYRIERISLLVWCVAMSMGLGLAVATDAHRARRAADQLAMARSAAATQCTLPAEFAPTREVVALSRDIAARFNVNEGVASSITQEAFSAAREHGVEPILVLAVVAVESGYQPEAINESSGAKGLMQVLPKWHADKIRRIGGERHLLLVAPNLNVGTAILAEYLRRERGDVDGALRRYSGSLNEQYYSGRVQQQMHHFSKVVATLG
jgi:soluble lytic murein transglycosylase-like protein